MFWMCFAALLLIFDYPFCFGHVLRTRKATPVSPIFFSQHLGQQWLSPFLGSLENFLLLKQLHSRINLYFNIIYEWYLKQSYVNAILNEHLIKFEYILKSQAIDINPPKHSLGPCSTLKQNQTNPRNPLLLSENGWGVQSPPKRKVFRFHHHSEKVISFLGKPIPNPIVSDQRLEHYVALETQWV